MAFLAPDRTLGISLPYAIASDIQDEQPPRRVLECIVCNLVQQCHHNNITPNHNKLLIILHSSYFNFKHVMPSTLSWHWQLSADFDSYLSYLYVIKISTKLNERLADSMELRRVNWRLLSICMYNFQNKKGLSGSGGQSLSQGRDQVGTIIYSRGRRVVLGND